MLTKNAVGNLIKKYSAVLKKCAWLNTCVLAGAVMCAGVGNAWGAELEWDTIINTAGGYTLNDDAVVTDIDSASSISLEYIFDGGNFILTSDDTEENDDNLFQVTTNGLLTLKNVTIDDLDCTVVMIGDGGITNITGGTVNITGVTIKNTDIANAWYASAIYNYQGNLSISDFKLIDNKSTNIRSGSGGAIRNIAGTISLIEGGTFSGNSSCSTHGGGAIYSEGNITAIRNVTFGGERSEDGNSAENQGGAIKNGVSQNNITGSIEGSTFMNNHAYQGGAIYNGGTINTITSLAINGNDKRTVFANNTAEAWGGAICNGPTQIINISNADFNYNKATGVQGKGGAIHNGFLIGDYDNTGGIYNVSFTGNEATLGGAICNDYFITNIENASFNANKASNGYGGAILNLGMIPNINNVDFIDNEAVQGGGIMAYLATSTTITDSSFVGNKAIISPSSTDPAQGGALYLQGAASDNDYWGNTYYVSGARLLYTATKSLSMAGNIASDGGGFLYLGDNNYVGKTDDNGNPIYGAQALFDIQGADTIFTIGAEDKINNSDDSIHSESGAIFTKTGAGTMLVRSTYTNKGALIVDEGAMILEGDVAKEGEKYWFESDNMKKALGDTSNSTVLMLGTSLNVGDGLCVGGGHEEATDAVGLYIVSQANNAHIGANSVLVLHADGTGAQGTGAALIGNDTDSVLTVEEGAKLVICGGDATSAIRIAQGFVKEAAATPTVMARTAPATRSVPATPSTSGGTPPTIKGWIVDPENTDTDDVTHVNPLYTVTGSHWGEENGAYSLFLSLEVNKTALGDLAQLASIAGVASNTASIATSAMDASGARFAFADFEPELERRFNLWATPLFSSVYADGFDSSREGKGGRSGYDTKFGGMNIGADYTTDKGYRFGLGLHAGYGETESHGDYEHTDNDFSFWGVTLYAGRTWDDFSIYADVNMSMTKSDLVQDNPAFADASLDAETDAYALTAEVRADYRISTEYMEILPHVGARFMNVNIDDYDVKQLGDTICSVESKDQNIWSFPVGVELSKTFDLGVQDQEGQSAQADQRNWNLTPRLDLGVIVATGDINADSTAFMPDRSLSQSMTMQTFDRFAYTANLGVDMEYGNSTFGLEYGARLSEHQTVQDVTATWRYEF